MDKNDFMTSMNAANLRQMEMGYAPLTPLHQGMTGRRRYEICIRGADGECACPPEPEDGQDENSIGDTVGTYTCMPSAGSRFENLTKEDVLKRFTYIYCNRYTAERASTSLSKHSFAYANILRH